MPLVTMMEVIMLAMTVMMTRAQFFSDFPGRVNDELYRCHPPLGNCITLQPPRLEHLLVDRCLFQTGGSHYSPYGFDAVSEVRNYVRCRVAQIAIRDNVNVENVTIDATSFLAGIDKWTGNAKMKDALKSAIKSCSDGIDTSADIVTRYEGLLKCTNKASGALCQEEAEKRANFIRDSLGERGSDGCAAVKVPEEVLTQYQQCYKDTLSSPCGLGPEFFTQPGFGGGVFGGGVPYDDMDLEISGSPFLVHVPGSGFGGALGGFGGHPSFGGGRDYGFGGGDMPDYGSDSVGYGGYSDYNSGSDGFTDYNFGSHTGGDFKKIHAGYKNTHINFIKHDNGLSPEHGHGAKGIGHGRRRRQIVGRGGGREGGSSGFLPSAHFGAKAPPSRHQHCPGFLTPPEALALACVAEANGYGSKEEGLNFTAFVDFVSEFEGWADIPETQDKVRMAVEDCATSFFGSLAGQIFDFDSCFRFHFGDACGCHNPLAAFFFPDRLRCQRIEPRVRPFPKNPAKGEPEGGPEGGPPPTETPEGDEDAGVDGGLEGEGEASTPEGDPNEDVKVDVEGENSQVYPDAAFDDLMFLMKEAERQELCFPQEEA